MKTYFRIVLPIFITVFVYAALSGFFGPKGLYSKKFMETQRDALIAKVNSLNLTGNDLDNHIEDLRNDPDTIAIYAHELGYIYENEGIIKLAGFNSELSKMLNPGAPLKISQPHFISDYICKTISFSFGIIVIICEMLVVRKKYAYKKER